MYENKKTFESILVLIVDLCSLIFSMGIAFWIRYGIFYGRFEHGDQIWLLLFAIALYGLIFVLLDFSHHFFRRGMFDEFVNVVKSELIFSAVLIMALFVMHRSADLSRLVLGYQIVINTVVMYAARVIFKQYMVKVYRNSRHSNRLLVVTSSDQAGDVIENLKEYNEWNRTIAGLVLTDEAKVEEIGEIPVVAHREDFLNYVIRNDVDEIFIIDDKLMRTPLMNEWVRELEQMGIIVDVNIDAFDLSVSGKKSLNRVGKYAAVTFARNLFSTRQMIAKRALDIVGSMVGMIILGIATIFVAPAIKLDSPGPVFFKQKRNGLNDKEFYCYKFRSMRVNTQADSLQATKDDPRKTRWGNIMRKTSIDELPQFINVLLGDMSVVGPRPHMLKHTEEYSKLINKYMVRHFGKPGITGWSQVTGYRGETKELKDMEGRIRGDIWYIEHWSFGLDLFIIYKTVANAIHGEKNAY